MIADSDAAYLEMILSRIRICKDYRPKFGQSSRSGLTYDQFQTLYGSDPFYVWFGLDIPLMYAAHRAAGGITSVYRQIGIGCEALFRQLLQDHLGLTNAQASWSYETETSYDQARRLTLDARLPIEAIGVENRRAIVAAWLNEAANTANVALEIRHALRGAVFEVRQGYKSKDSKRQNADIANAAYAYSQGYLPVVVMLSAQIDSNVARRYQRANLLLLRGFTQGSFVDSTYVFARDVIGYDLAGFFERNAASLKATTQEVLETLLEAE